MSNINYYYRTIDPEIIERLPTKNKDKARLKIIKIFLLKNYYNNFEGETEMKNIFMMKNSYKMFKLCTGMALIFNFICYKFMFTGIYEMGTIYFNPKTLPSIVKLGFSTIFSLKLLDNLWGNYINIPDLYEMAIVEYKNSGN